MFLPAVLPQVLGNLYLDMETIAPFSSCDVYKNIHDVCKMLIILCIQHLSPFFDNYVCYKNINA